MSPKSLTKQEIEVAPQLIQLGGDSHRGRTEGGAIDGRLKEEERSDAESSSDVSSPSVIEKILERQTKSLRERRRNFLTTGGIHRRTTNPSLPKHGAKRRRRRRHNEGKATHPELKAAQQLLQLSHTTSSSENNSETSHVTDASSAMETRELEINAARQMMRLSKKYSNNLKSEESEEEEEEECESNLSSIARKRVFVEECEVFCGRRKRKFRSLVDIYRKTKAL